MEAAQYREGVSEAILDNIYFGYDRSLQVVL